MFTVVSLTRSFDRYSGLIQCSVQTVRWVKGPRKPWWLGKAKTKMFKVCEYPDPDPQEYALLKPLYNVYRTHMKSIRAHLKMEYQKYEELGKDSNREMVMSTEIEESLARNVEWNAQSAAVRNARLVKEAREIDEQILAKIHEEELKEKQRMELAEKFVLAEKRKEIDFITADNIDEAIEKCLSDTTTFNFAIDLEGNVYEGDSPINSSSVEGPVKRKIIERLNA